MRTRARILDAAVAVLGSRGFAAASVNEIVAKAGIVNGSFYNYFKNLDDVAEVLGREATTALVDMLGTLTSEFDDAAEKIAYGVQWLIRESTQEADWGWLIVRALSDIGLGTFREQAFRVIKERVRHGRRQRRFDVDHRETLFLSIAGVMVAAIRSQLDGESNARGAAFAAELILRMLGISGKEARTLSLRAHKYLYGREPSSFERPDLSRPRQSAAAGITSRQRRRECAETGGS